MPFWFSAEHLQTALQPFWFSIDDISFFSISDMQWQECPSGSQRNIFKQHFSPSGPQLMIFHFSASQTCNGNSALLVLSRTSSNSFNTTLLALNGRYLTFQHLRRAMAIVPFWFSEEHLQTALQPFWLSTKRMIFHFSASQTCNGNSALLVLSRTSSNSVTALLALN